MEFTVRSLDFVFRRGEMKFYSTKKENFLAHDDRIKRTVLGAEPWIWLMRSLAEAARGFLFYEILGKLGYNINRLLLCLKRKLRW